MNAISNHILSASEPILSIITVTLDNLEGIRQTEHSLSAQTFQAFEWIVMDGASNDGTAAHLKNNSKVRLFSNIDTGIYDAMNRSLKYINGSFSLFLNAGDALAASDTLENIALTLGSAPECMIAYGDSFEQTPEGRFFKPARTHKAIRRGLFTHHQSIIYESARLKSLYYNTDYDIAADYDLTCRFLEGLQDQQIKRFPFAIALYEAGGISQKFANKGRRELLEIRQTLNLCNPVLNKLIYCAQWAAWQFRKFFPALYWLIKSNR